MQPEKLDYNSKRRLLVKFINPSELELKEESVVAINRVAKVITGGRRFRFNAIVVVGDGAGHVGVGFGKANEVMSAVNKAKEGAKKHLFKASIINGTIPHAMIAKYQATRVVLKPASPGTGIIAGAPVRAIMEQVGVTDILTKITGSTNPINVIRATEKALGEMRDAVTIARERGITVKELFT